VSLDTAFHISDLLGVNDIKIKTLIHNDIA